MKFFRYYKEGNYLRFTKLYPKFIAIVDCSVEPPKIREMIPGTCSPDQIVYNLDELYLFLNSKYFQELVHPVTSQDPL
jgi:hypothetical protein